MTDYPNNISAKLEIIKASEITPRIQYFPVDSIQTAIILDKPVVKPLNI